MAQGVELQSVGGADETAAEVLGICGLAGGRRPRLPTMPPALSTSSLRTSASPRPGNRRRIRGYRSQWNQGVLLRIICWCPGTEGTECSPRTDRTYRSVESSPRVVCVNTQRRASSGELGRFPRFGFSTGAGARYGSDVLLPVLALRASISFWPNLPLHLRMLLFPRRHAGFDQQSWPSH